MRKVGDDCDRWKVNLDSGHEHLTAGMREAIPEERER